MIKIPKCMSTQHPDNVNFPFFTQNSELGGEDEIQEAYYAFSHLGCDEQMWDCEGKEVDSHVVKKLLTKYGDYFKTKRLGKDLFITLRVPNPLIEKAEAKILLETLESIPRSFDAAKLFYGDDIPPIFEVILPMTTSSKCVNRIYHYYSDFVAGKQHKLFSHEKTKISEWIGEFKPYKINVIPLFEDMEHLLNADTITKEYLQDKVNLKDKAKDIEHQRVFLARSDPAMNYGLISAVLLNKIALQRLHAMSEEIGVKIYPIIGVGSAPFRGNLCPKTVKKIAEEYKGAHTFTIQSAFKFDNPPEEVKASIDTLKEIKTKAPKEIDEKKSLEIIKKYSDEYKKQVISLAPLINKVAKYIPNRRKRKLHIGLFGYSREVEGISLPRAIKFTAALYSIGLPPELLGLNALNEREVAFVKDTYVNFEDDLKASLRYFNKSSLVFLQSFKLKNIPIKDYYVDEGHLKMTNDIIEALTTNKPEHINEFALRAASIRRFLG